MHKITINKYVAYVTWSGIQKVASEFLEIKLFSFTASILERKTNITSIETGKEEDLADESECRQADNLAWRILCRAKWVHSGTGLLQLC